MIKTFAITLIFISSCFVTLAQANYTDSLKTVLSNAAKPIERFSILIKIIENTSAFQAGNLDSAACVELLHIAQQLKNDSLLVISYNWIGAYFSYTKGDNAAALEYYFKALALAEKMKDKQKISSLDFDISIAYFLLQNNEEAVIYVRKGGENLPDKSSTGYNPALVQYQRGMAIYYLAHQGFRAKNPNFSAEMKIDLDPALPQVNVIPQDIGRVLLNLYNNAFWALSSVASAKVGERTNLAGLQVDVSGVNPASSADRLPVFTYSPTVTLSTKNLNDSEAKLAIGSSPPHKIEIRIRDNGPGIPPHIIDKIFQPFFTTKPTGQGTGLGLSLAYDIVKAHGGVLKVKTKEGEGSEFIIQLPTN